MAAKRKGLADKIKEHQGKIISLADGFNLTKKTPAHVDTYTPEQVSTQQDNRTPAQQDTCTHEHIDNRTPAQQDGFNSELKPKDLKPNQYVILREIYFKRPFKVKGNDRIGTSAKIPYGSVRNILKSLTKKGYITKPFSINDGVNKGTTCQVNELKCVPVFGLSHIINSEHVDNRTPEYLSTWTPAQQDNRASAQQDTSYNSQLVSSLKKLTNYVKNSPFLKDKGFTEKQFRAWIEDNGTDPVDLYLQIQIAEQLPEIQKPKKSAIGYFYTAAILGTGLKPPVGFQTAEQKKLERIKKMQAEIDAVEDAERMQAFMADPVILNEIAQGVMSMKKPPVLWVQDADVWTKEGKVQGHIRRQAKRLFEEQKGV